MPSKEVMCACGKAVATIGRDGCYLCQQCRRTHERITNERIVSSRIMNGYRKQVIAIAKQYGFTEEGDLILWGVVERFASQGKAEMEMGIHCGAKREIAILLMALEGEERKNSYNEGI